MSLLIHTHTLMAEKAQGHTVHRQVHRDCFVEMKSLSHLRKERDTQGPPVVLSFIGLPHTNLKAENICFYQQRVDSRNHSFTPYWSPPCVFLQSRLHCAQSEKAKSKAPLLQSSTRLPLHLAGSALK